jgi:ferredoxin
MRLCEHHHPDTFDVGDGHQSRCWLQHEASPRTIEALHVPHRQTANP